MTVYTFCHAMLSPMDLAGRLRSSSLPPYNRHSVTPHLWSAMLSFYNARDGSRRDDDERWNVRGPQGNGDLSDTGRDLLSFLSINEATICNSWFQKHKATWQHPGTKQWHCIDFASCDNHSARSAKM